MDLLDKGKVNYKINLTIPNNFLKLIFIVIFIPDTYFSLVLCLYYVKMMWRILWGPRRISHVSETVGPGNTLYNSATWNLTGKNSEDKKNVTNKD